MRKGRVRTNGDQGVGGEGEERTEVRVATRAPVSVMWSLASGVSQVPSMSYLFSNLGARGNDSRRAEGKLVERFVVPSRGAREIRNLPEGVDDVV